MSVCKEPQDVVDKRFGIIIRKWRHDRKLTIAEASYRMRMSELRLSALELGKAEPSVKFTEVESLAKIYGIEMSIVYHMAIGADIK